MSTLHISAFYSFFPLQKEQLSEIQSELLEFGKTHGMRGLVLLATEGINGTVAGSSEGIGSWKAKLEASFGDIVFKDSEAGAQVFKRWSVKVKPEIVSLKRPDILPKGKRKHLTPAEWKEALEKEDVIVLDARNDYEYELGKFRGAVKSGTESFHEFPEKIRDLQLPKNKKIMMYCTGGIRCEKALIAMEEEGYKDVYQLEGGILGYLKQFPGVGFEGECFVFDYRVAVDQNLQPSQIYDICPHCGMPGSRLIECAACNMEQKICNDCYAELHRRTCSKRCANAVRLRHYAA